MAKIRGDGYDQIRDRLIRLNNITEVFRGFSAQMLTFFLHDDICQKDRGFPVLTDTTHFQGPSLAQLGIYGLGISFRSPCRIARILKRLRFGV